MRNKQLASCKYFELLEIIGGEFVYQLSRLSQTSVNFEGLILIVLCLGVDFVLFEPYVRFHSFS